MIVRRFGVPYYPRYLELLLKAHGFSVQRSATQARERDEYVIARWPTHEWMALKKALQQQGSRIRDQRLSVMQGPATARLHQC